MKSTDEFKKTIQEYLEQRAKEDELFAIVYKKKGKNINDCITYIFNTVQKSGCNGFTDDEVFSMAVHYYDEDDIKIGKPINCDVIVNHKVSKGKEKETTPSKKTVTKTKQEIFESRQLNLF